MSLTGIPLDTMTEDELHELKRDRNLAFLTIQAEYRADSLVLQDHMTRLREARYATYIETAANTPGSVSTQIG